MLKACLLLAAACIHHSHGALQVAKSSQRHLVHRRHRARALRCRAAPEVAPPILDDLTLEEFALRLSEVRAHYRKTGELTQDRVCMNMLATRCADLHLNRCRTGPSRLQDGGTGLFATRDIRAGELITLYPGDALLYWKDGQVAMSASKQLCSGVVFGVHIPMGERDVDRVTSADARQYEICASSTLSCVGDPRLADNPAYLGHFTNDGVVCASPEGAATYRVATRAAANADHVTLEGCHLATQATRDIVSGDEILVTYGEGYWLSRFMDVESQLPDPPAKASAVLSVRGRRPERSLRAIQGRRPELHPATSAPHSTSPMTPPSMRKGRGGARASTGSIRGKAGKKAGHGRAGAAWFGDRNAGGGARAGGASSGSRGMAGKKAGEVWFGNTDRDTDCNQ